MTAMACTNIPIGRLLVVLCFCLLVIRSKSMFASSIFLIFQKSINILTRFELVDLEWSMMKSAARLRLL